jgi:hypothetical protein
VKRATCAASGRREASNKMPARGPGDTPHPLSWQTGIATTARRGCPQPSSVNSAGEVGEQFHVKRHCQARGLIVLVLADTHQRAPADGDTRTRPLAAVGRD